MMKKISLVVVLFLSVAATVQAQEFKKFQLYVGLGYAKPGGDGASGGILFDIEPSYRVNDALAVGFRWESAAMGKVAADGSSAEVSANGSYTLNGRYYFSSGTFRPYAGVGVGLVSLAAVTADTGGAGVSAESKVGFYPRLGFDLGHFNINLDYNIIGATEAQGFDINGNPKTYEIKNSYLGIRIGGFFFGGRK